MSVISFPSQHLRNQFLSRQEEYNLSLSDYLYNYSFLLFLLTPSLLPSLLLSLSFFLPSSPQIHNENLCAQWEFNVLNVKNMLWTQEKYMGWINVTSNLTDKPGGNISIFIFLDLSAGSKDLTTPSVLKLFSSPDFHTLTMTWFSCHSLATFQSVFLGLHPLLDHHLLPKSIS